MAQLGDDLWYATAAGKEGDDHVGLIVTGKGHHCIAIADALLLQCGVAAAIAVNDRYVGEACSHFHAFIIVLFQNSDGNLVIEMEKKDKEECCDGKECKEGKNRRYIRREFSYAKFRQTLLLPENAERDEIHAKAENGVLHVCIPKMLKPKTEEEKREIEIR